MAFLGFHSFMEFNAFVTFVSIGVSLMLVLGAITAAPSFVNNYYKFATGNPDAVCENPKFWVNVRTYINAGTFGTQLITEFFTLIPSFRLVPLRYRMYVGLFIPFIELLVILLIPVFTVKSQSTAAVAMMLISVLGGFSKAICDTTVNALVAPFPTRFVNGELWGVAIASLMMSILESLLKLWFGNTYNDVNAQSRVYFGIAIAFQAFVLVEFFFLQYNPYAHKYIAEFRYMYCRGNPDLSEPHTGSTDAIAADTKDGVCVVDRNAATTEDDATAAHGSRICNLKEQPDDEMNQHNTASILHTTGDADNMFDLDQVDNITSGQQMHNTNAFHVIKKVWPMLFSCFSVYFITMLLFPGVFTAVDASAEWFGTIIALLYGASDFASRLALMVRRLRPSPMVCLVGSFVRMAIIPVILLCVHGTIKGYWMPYILITLMGLTNGLFGVMAMIHCSRTVTLNTAGQRSIANLICGICLQLGLALGSNLAIAVNLSL